MIRSRDRRSRQHRRRMRRGAPRDHCDEPLRVLVRVLARQAALGRFELMVVRDSRCEVDVASGGPFGHELVDVDSALSSGDYCLSGSVAAGFDARCKGRRNGRRHSKLFPRPTDDPFTIVAGERLQRVEPIRPTKDVDLLGFGDTSAEALKRVFVSLCATEAPEDGLTFLPESVQVEAIREDQSTAACASS